MRLKIKQLTLNNKLIVYTVGLLIVSGLIIGILGFRLTHEALNRKGETILKNSVQTAMLLVEQQHLAYTNGEESMAVIQERIKESLLGPMRDDGTRSIDSPIDLGPYGYFIIYDSLGNEIMHPTLEGINVWDVVDKNPNLETPFYLVQDKIEKSQNGGGFTYYTWDVPFEDRMAEKIVYSAYFEPWDWVVTAGTYMEDFNREARAIIEMTIVVLLVVVAIGFIITKRYISGIAIPLMDAEDAMKALSDGKYKYLARSNRKDEVGRLVNGYNNMLQAIEEKDQRLEYYAYFDDMTGLANRNETRERINRRINEVKNCGHLVLLDIKDFKSINSVYGSNYGDEIIKLMGKTLIKLETETLKFSRLSGNEFAAWIENCKNEEVAHLLSIIRNEIKHALNAQGYAHHLTFYLGGCVSSDAIDAYDALYKKAAVALQYAKEHEIYEYVRYEDAMLASIERESMILKHAEIDLKNGDFHVHYQTKVTIADQNVVGVEALARWFSPALGLVSPGEFIPILNRTNLMVTFSEYIVLKALEDYRKLMLQYGEGITLSVNICPTMFYQEHFTEFIVKGLKQFDVDPQYLILEITEDLFISDFDLVRSKIKALRSHGVKISLDDFGTGFSSLNYLKSFALDEVKIDRIFLNEIHKDERALSMLNSIVALAHTLDYIVVAEGIEHEEQLACLEKVGCRIAQGFYFSKPEGIGK